MHRRGISSAGLIVAFVLLTAEAAAQSLPIDEGVRGEFARAGAGFACKIAPPPGFTADDVLRVGNQPCLHFGSVAIGADAPNLLAKLGAPAKTVPQENGVTAHVYVPGTGQPPPYVVISVQRDRVIALQMTGRQAIPGLDFAGIKLGSAVAAVEPVLGKPMTIRRAPNGADLWSYDPWTFSLEVTAGMVTSIRIAAP